MPARLPKRPTRPSDIDLLRAHRWLLPVRRLRRALRLPRRASARVLSTQEALSTGVSNGGDDGAIGRGTIGSANDNDGYGNVGNNRHVW